MARTTIEKITSDLSGKDLDDDSKSVQFGLNGVQYEIDLTASEMKELEKALAKFIEAGRKVPTRGGARKTSAATGPDPKAVREWAANNNIDVPSRGRIPAAVLEAYNAAN